MKVEEAPDGSLTVTNTTWWPALGAVAFGSAAVAVWLRDPPRSADVFWGFVIALSAVACLAGLEHTRFHFDRAARRVVWTRRRLLKRDAGEIPFADIHTISLEQAFDSESGRRSNARRIDLHTTVGLVPLTTSYSGGSQLEVAERIRGVVGLRDAVVV